MSRAFLLEAPIKRWYCPACAKTDVTREIRPHVRYHPCPKMGFMSTPMVEEGVKAKIEAKEREDYVGDDLVQVDANGRAIMSIVTTRDDGTDAVVFAPTATGRSD